MMFLLENLNGMMIFWNQYKKTATNFVNARTEMGPRKTVGYADANSQLYHIATGVMNVGLTGLYKSHLQLGISTPCCNKSGYFLTARTWLLVYDTVDGWNPAPPGMYETL